MSRKVPAKAIDGCGRPSYGRVASSISPSQYREMKKGGRSKYGNVKTTVGRETFDSKREALRHVVLKQMERDGKISMLHRQRSFDLIVNGKKICRYVGDWAYVENHKAVVEDCKGYQTPAFKLKWKLCKALYPDIEWRLS